MTPVSSSTPDEQRREVIGDLRTIVRMQEPGYGLLAAEIEAAGRAADLLEADAASRAALVVVREQLTQAQARIAAVERVVKSPKPRAATVDVVEAFDRGWDAACDVIQAALNPPPSPPTYTTEDGQLD